jgi:hypothetical protein
MPDFRPGHEFAPIPEATLAITPDRLGEAAIDNDLARPPVAYAEDVGDLDQPDVDFDTARY